jgi:prepilin-type processing-associated H-X9-DG protein/prepilin-type N-terminal cleavage/methylation domain-containing protein
MTQHLDRRDGFTIVELVVVLAIIGLLTGLLLAGVQRVREAAVRAKCHNNLRQIAMALHNFESTHRALPEGCSGERGSPPLPFISWNTRILPFLERNDLWVQAQQAYAKDKDFRHDPPHPFTTVLPFFACESDARTLVVGDAANGLQVAFTIYLGVLGNNLFRNDGVLFFESQVRLMDVTDGASHTLMVGERPPSPDLILGWWYAGWGQNKSGSMDMTLGVRERNVYGPYQSCPRGPFQFEQGRLDNSCDAFHFWSLHPGGANFAFCDGSVRFLAYAADPIMPALATRAGGEAVSVPE